MMDPKLAAILKKAKAIDKKAQEYDTTNRISEGTQGFSDMGGMSQQIDYPEREMPNMMEQRINQMSSQPKATTNPQNSNYNELVENSKLPPEVKAAMMENPIPQASVETVTGGFQVDQDLINEVNGYEQPTQRKQQMVTEEVMDKKSMRRVIAEEVAKALPKVIEQYFDKSVLKENIQIKVGGTVFSGNLKPLPKKK